VDNLLKRFPGGLSADRSIWLRPGAGGKPQEADFPDNSGRWPTLAATESAKSRLNGENGPKAPETGVRDAAVVKKLLFIINGFAFRRPFCQEIK
jgi:hypothetical protein